MSHPAIGIGHPVSDPPVARPRTSCARPRPRNLMVRYSRIPHMPYGIRNPGIGNRESWREASLRSDAFEANPREHWSECGPKISSLI
jgi:hypothetical protein